MDLSKMSIKKIRELIVFTALLVVALWKFDVVLGVLKTIWDIIFPFVLGGAIAFLDRLFFSTANVDKTMKVGAAVTTCRRGGNTASYDVLNKYFSISSMPIATSQYWNMVYGGQAEEVLQDKEGLQTMRTLGKNIAFMAKSIALGKEQFGLPEKEQITFTNFHH